MEKILSKLKTPLLLFLILSGIWWLTEELYFKTEINVEPIFALFGLFYTLVAGSEFFKSRDNKIDAGLFKELQEIFPTDCISFLKGQYFEAHSFEAKGTDPVNAFVNTWDTVDKVFLNPKIEKAKKKLYSVAESLAFKIAEYTIPSDEPGRRTVYPRTQSKPYPKHLIEQADELNKLASDFVTTYEAFITNWRPQLAS